MEFTAGFVCGAAIVLIVWLMLAKTSRPVHVYSDSKPVIMEDKPAVKPDNKKVRAHSSVEYRNERAYVESQRKKGKHEGVSGAK